MSELLHLGSVVKFTRAAALRALFLLLFLELNLFYFMSSSCIYNVIKWAWLWRLQAAF